MGHQIIIGIRSQRCYDCFFLLKIVVEDNDELEDQLTRTEQ